MSKGFCYSFAVMSTLMFGAGVANTIFVGSTMAEERTCDHCGHIASKAENGCKCERHRAKC
ncbi:MAG: hypothetical protein B6D34_05610 [Candidatus Brocadia sp. UTAMX1]|nr:MAG: hypothetical protein B6D34_05610 [Candidatus Brocadia sp. UTAMX1]